MKSSKILSSIMRYPSSRLIFAHLNQFYNGFFEKNHVSCINIYQHFRLLLAAVLTKVCKTLAKTAPIRNLIIFCSVNKRLRPNIKNIVLAFQLFITTTTDCVQIVCTFYYSHEWTKYLFLFLIPEKNLWFPPQPLHFCMPFSMHLL